MRKGQGALGLTGSNGPVMDDIADNNKDSIYQIAESKARQNGANDAHVCIFNEDCAATTDYGRPTKPFFIEIPNLCLGRQFGQIHFGAFGHLG